MGEQKARIEFLDGMRGLAILLVLGFHGFSRWPESYPYGDRFAGIGLFEMGWLGVNLFFLISGFVILMTLEKTTTRRTFVYRRWIRLFPAMLIASALIYLTARALPGRPAGQPIAISLLPGLTFIDPGWWSRLLGFNVPVMEDAFWSLYVEFKFYIFAAIVFYWRGRKLLLVSLVIVYGLHLFSVLLVHDNPADWARYFRVVVYELSFEFFGWFAAGAFFYVYVMEKSNTCFALGLIMMIVSSVFVRGINWDAAVYALIVSSIFVLAILNEKLQALLSTRFFIFMGAVSYPLYLIHENLMVGLIVEISDYLPTLPALIYPLVSLIIVIGLAYLIANYGERKVKSVIQSIVANR